MNLSEANMSTRSQIEKELLRSVAGLSYIEPDMIPNIDLYMDQVTTFMNEHLSASKRFDDDKILTKTMINNYTKGRILPPPEKKKYSREHMLLLIFVYYFKSILSINDMKELLNPITDKYFGKDEINMEYIYEEVFDEVRSSFHTIAKDIDNKFKKSEESFMDVPEDEREMLQHFSLICMLSFEIYVKELLINKLIDIDSKKYREKGEKENKKENDSQP